MNRPSYPPKCCFQHSQNNLSYSTELNTFYRLTPIIERRVSAKKRGEPIPEIQWNEIVREIWKENGLKHLRDAATPFEYDETFIYDPSKGTYGFQEGYEIGEDNEFVFIDPSDHDELNNKLPQNQPAQDEPTQSVTSYPEKPQETLQQCKV